jgi:hypothetical protein
MTTPRSLLLHIGTHKTGTTSIQAFLREELGAPTFPVGFYPGYENCHAEWLVASSLDFERADRAPTRDKLQREAASEAPLLVYSCETISTFRDADRVARVRELVGDRELHVVLYTRSPDAFLPSYAFTRALLGAKPSSDPDSEDYVEADSWLVDYAPRIALWQRYADRVTVMDYDEVCARDGSVIPSFAALVGVTPARDYRLNTTADLRVHVADALRASTTKSS